MYIVELVGVFSSGKSTIIQEMIEEDDVVTIQNILPIRRILKQVKAGLFQNIIMELYFLLRFNFRMILKVNKIVSFDLSGFGVIDRFKLYRSAVRKIGFVLFIEEKRKCFLDKILVVDEGFYQLIQSAVSPKNRFYDFSKLLDIGYNPDLLIITNCSVKTVFERSRIRKDLTSRYRKLSDDQLLFVIRNSLRLFSDFGYVYSTRLNCSFKRLESLTPRDLKSQGVIILNHE